jgi:antitoxin component of MazEF toxin-antitoxin module
MCSRRNESLRREVLDVFTQQVRRSGDCYTVEIPADEVERLGLVDGQQVHVLLTPVEAPRLRPELQEAWDRLWPEIEPGLRYLKDR